MGLFQARAGGEIWNGNDDSNGDPIRAKANIFEIVDRMSSQLNRYALAKTSVGALKGAKRSKITSVLPSTTSSTIATGSYVLEMPTQEDRTATVVFPPGPKSLEDINYMLGGMGDDPKMTTRILKRAVATATGGFKLVLEPSS